jgi:hypothetical protein
METFTHPARALLALAMMLPGACELYAATAVQEAVAAADTVQFGSPVEVSPGLVQFAPDGVSPAPSTSSRVEPLGTSLGTNAIRQQTQLEPLSATQMEEIKRQDALGQSSQSKGRLRIGIGRTLDKPLTVNLSTAPASEWVSVANGWRIWLVSVTSPGAEGIRVHLENIKLPDGARLVAYAPAKPQAGPAITAQTLRSATEAWAETILGERLVVECQLPPQADPSAVSFTITEISQIYLSLATALGTRSPCENDVTCYAAWATAASGVARIEFIDSGSAYLCTGCLLTTVPATYVPYFLTANHCVTTPTIASTLELWWFYQSSNCNGPAPALDSVPHTAGGADYLAGSSENDFTFLHLRMAPPAGAAFLGWSTANPASATTLTGIHHPGGDIKKISFGGQNSLDLDFRYVRWSSGVTEPGSSGSPLFNASQQVLGQLWGGSSACDNPTGLDHYGRFDLTYNSIAQWLYPPVNNVCGGAVALTDNVYYVQNTMGASDDATPCAGTVYKGIWFTFRASVTGMVTIDTCPSDFDTLLEVFTGSCGALTSIGCDNDSCGNLKSSLTFPTLAGTVYHICAGGYGGNSGNLHVRAHVAAAPISVIGLAGNMAFGSVPATQTATQHLVITNRGTATLNVSGISYPAGFSGAWSGSISPLSSHSVAVLFNPTDQGGYGGSVVVSSDASLGSGSVPISGTGYWPLTNAWSIWWQHTNGTLARWSMLGSTNVSTTRLSPPSAGTGWRVAGTADFNADQQTDLLFESTRGAVAAWLMNDANQQSASYLTPGSTDPAWQIAGTGDIKNDGQRDILWQKSDGSIAAWLMSGFTAQSIRFNPASTDPSWRLAGSGQFNNDSQTDLLWQNRDGRLAVWFMNTTNRVGTSYLSPSQVDPNWRLVGVVDSLNGDGQPGLLWEHTNGGLAYWQMAGTNCVHSGRLYPAAVDPAWQIVGPK